MKKQPPRKIAIPVFDADGAVFHCFKVLPNDRLGKRLPDVRVENHGSHRQGFYYVNTPLEVMQLNNHPNRSKKSPKEGRSPTKEEVKAARASAGLTQPESAKLVYRTTNAWARWEGGDRKMPADTWELFQIKINSPEEKEKLMKKLIQLKPVKFN